MVQRRCSRYVTGNFYRTSSVTSLLNYRSRSTLEERRRQYRLAEMYRILHVQVDFHWQSFLTKTSSCIRGHSCRLIVPFCKNHVYASSFFPRTNKAGITLPSIQVMHHPLKSLPGCWGMTMPRFLLLFMFCFVSSLHHRHQYCAFIFRLLKLHFSGRRRRKGHLSICCMLIMPAQRNHLVYLLGHDTWNS